MDWQTVLMVASFVVALSFFMTKKMSLQHQRAALPLHHLIVIFSGLIALACVGGGIFAIQRSATANTEFEMLGVKLSTGHVGVAFVALGLIVGYFTVKSVLKSQRELAALPPDKPKRRNVKPQ